MKPKSVDKSHDYDSYLIFLTEGKDVRGTAGFAHRTQCSETWTTSLKDLHTLRGIRNSCTLYSLIF